MKNGPLADLRLSLSRKSADYFQEGFRQTVEFADLLQEAGLCLRRIGLVLRRAALFTRIYFDHPDAKKAVQLGRMMYTPALTWDELRHNSVLSAAMRRYFQNAGEAAVEELETTYPDEGDTST